PTGICYNIPGSYTVALIASNANGNDTLTLSNYITVYPNSPPQSIQQSGDTLTSNTGFITYQWMFNGDTIAGATNYFYVAGQSGDYNVICTDSNGCEVEAGIVNVVAGIQSTVDGQQSTVYPNPVSEKFEIRNWKLGTAAYISIFNLVGEIVYESAVNRKPSTVNSEPFTVDCRLFPDGIYLLELHSNEKTFRTKFVKQ